MFLLSTSIQQSVHPILQHGFANQDRLLGTAPIHKKKTIMTQKNLLKSLVFIALTFLLLNGCIPATPPASTATALESDMPLPNDTPHTIAEVEKLAGFDVKEPKYLPNEVSFDFATYQKSPYPNVTLYFKYSDRGIFFQIVQEPQEGALPNPDACGANGDECETLQIDSITVKYRLTAPTETLMWNADGFSFHLLRTAGEPNKVYKDELLKIVESMN